MTASSCRRGAKQLVRGEDERHFGRPTDIDWLPDGTFFVSDGYTNTRVVKFSPEGKYLTSWGTSSEGQGQPGPERDAHRAQCRGRARSQDLRLRSHEQPHSDLRRERQVPRYVDEHPPAVSRADEPRSVSLGVGRRDAQDAEVQTSAENSCMAGARSARCRAASTACTSSQWIRRTTCTSPKSSTGARRNSVRARAPIRAKLTGQELRHGALWTK